MSTIEVTYYVSTLALELLGDGADAAMEKISEQCGEVIKDAEGNGSHTGSHFFGGMVTNPNWPEISVYTFNGDKVAEDKWKVYVDKGYFTSMHESFDGLPDEMREKIGEVCHENGAPPRLPKPLRIDCPHRHVPAGRHG